MRTSRRAFLKAAVATPLMVTSPVFGDAAPGEPIRLAIIGIGRCGAAHLRSLAAMEEVRIVAVCDVDGHRLRIAHALVRRFGVRACLALRDFRQALVRDDVDAVVIATPDHWHAAMAVAALKAGKHVYCETPLAHSIAEGRAVAEFARRYGRVVQTGSIARSIPAVRHACEMVRGGWIGRLHRVWLGLPADRPDVGLQAAAPIPPELDYEMWLGPAPWRPYTKAGSHFNWRYQYDFGGGEIADGGAHAADIALWGAGPLPDGPIEVASRGLAAFYRNSLFDTAIQYHVEMRCPDGLRVMVSSNRQRGVKFEGDDGWVFAGLPEGHVTASQTSLLSEVIRPDQTHLHQSDNHFADFVRAIRTGDSVAATAADGHAAATLCHLCNIALRLGRKVTWHTQVERFIDDPEAQRLTAAAMRGPWGL